VLPDERKMLEERKRKEEKNEGKVELSEAVNAS
jgi:hypothetical protein